VSFQSSGVGGSKVSEEEPFDPFGAVTEPLPHTLSKNSGPNAETSEARDAAAAAALQRRAQASVAQQRALEEKLEQLKKRQTDLEKANEELRVKVKAQNRTIQASQERVNKLATQREQLEQANSQLKAERENAVRSIESALAEKAETETKLREVLAEKDELEVRIAGYDGRVASLREEVQQLEGKHKEETAALTKRLRETKADASQGLSQMAKAYIETQERHSQMHWSQMRGEYARLQKQALENEQRRCAELATLIESFQQSQQRRDEEARAAIRSLAAMQQSHLQSLFQTLSEGERRAHELREKQGNLLVEAITAAVSQSRTDISSHTEDAVRRLSQSLSLQLEGVDLATPLTKELEIVLQRLEEQVQAVVRSSLSDVESTMAKTHQQYRKEQARLLRTTAMSLLDHLEVVGDVDPQKNSSESTS